MTVCQSRGMLLYSDCEDAYQRTGEQYTVKRRVGNAMALRLT
jgi:hypothetical protein